MTPAHDFPKGALSGACRRCGLRFRIEDRGRSASPRFVVVYSRRAPNGGGRHRENPNDLGAFPCRA